MGFDSVVAKANNIPELFFLSVTDTPNRVLYSFPVLNEKELIWKQVTYSNSAKKIRAISSFLQSKGVKKGTPVAIICGTRPEWMEIDLAILSLGAITVSIYPSLPHTDSGFILFDSEAKVVFAENEEQLNKLRTLEIEETFIPARDDLPQLKTKLSFDTIITIEATSPHPKAISLDSIVSTFQNNDPDLQTASLTREDVASLVYTSGTTGPSKGVIQTHGNHLANVEQAICCGMFALEGTLFLFLPLAHSFARLIGYLGFLTPAFIKFCGVADTKSSKVDLAKVAHELRLADANVLPSVPRLFEKIKATLEERSQNKSLQGRILSIALTSAWEVYSAKIEGKKATVAASLKFVMTIPIRRKIKRSIFGRNFWHAISGGAKMPADVNHFFWSLNIPIFEGYGLTETCVATNVNRLGRNVIGSVGPPLDGVITKIADDGEILFKGPNITKAYLHRAQATKESWDAEGWFHTGDVGHIDDQGLLFITDRKKDLVITAGGKKIPPQKVENLITQSPYISQAIFCGDGKPFCVALVTLIPGTIKEALSARKIAVQEMLHTQKEVIDLIEAVRKSVNEKLSSFEAVKKIAIIPDEFTIENGLLTPTLKIKRKVALARYKDVFEKLYEY